MGRKFCDHGQNLDSNWRIDWEICANLSLWLVHLSLAAYFTRCLLINSRDKITNNLFIQSVLSYILLSSLSLTWAIYLMFLEPIRQENHSVSIQGCATFDFFAYFSGFLTFMSLLETLILRLEVTFESSVYKVRSIILRSLHGTVAMTIAFGLIMLIIRASLVNCFIQVNNGFLKQLNLKHDTFLICDTSKRHQWISYFVISGAGLMYAVASLLLGYMFLSRMRTLNQRIGGVGGSTNRTFAELIYKSTTLVISTVVCNLTLIIISIISGMGSFIYLDLTITLLFLLCHFKSGDHVYEFLFGKCVNHLKTKYPELTGNMAGDYSRTLSQSGSKVEFEYRIQSDTHQSSDLNSDLNYHQMEE